MKKLIYYLIIFPFIYSSLMAGTTGKLSGTVKDATTGETLVGANIIIKGTTLGAASDLDGYYSMININPGVYDITCSYLGYSAVTQKNVEVNADRTTRLDFSLTSITVSTAQIEITAKREVIVRDLTSTLSVMQSDQIKSLPVENINDVLQLQAGVTKDEGGGLHMRGGRSSEIQYYIDGMAVSNPFGGGLAVNVQNNSIQELQVISGTFNAEYGQAMSGIVNIITKDGGDKTEGSISVYGGDFLSTRDDIFMNIDKINITDQQYIEGSLSGPIPFLNKKIQYHISARFRNEENWLYGQRKYMPGDTTNFLGTDPSLWSVQQTGDNAIIPLNPARNISYQGKLSYKPFDNMKVTYNLIADFSKYKNYNNSSDDFSSHRHMYNPEFLRTNYLEGYNNLFTATHTLNRNYFHELKLSYYKSDLEINSRENPFDPIFEVGIQRSRPLPANVFFVGGIDPRFLYRTSTTKAAKYELTGQVDRYNMVKVGAEYRQHRLIEDFFYVIREQYTNWQLAILDPLHSPLHNYYDRKPVEISSYIQDKIEIEDLIVNIGVRFDYFDAKSQVATDMDDPENPLLRKNASAKTQVSPRFGLAFPVSDRGNLHVSYGQFFQIPEFSRLYENPEFEVIGERFSTYIGNADLEAQRTTVYEIGIQQQIADNLVINATCFYKDCRNLTGTKLFETYYYQGYGQYANADFGTVWGATIALDLLKTGPFTAMLDYTFQVADGNGSDPREAFNNARNRDETSKTLVPLNWDQRHILNGTINIEGDSWGLSLITRFSSGFPFNPNTTFLPNNNVQLQSQGRYKPEYNMDMRIYRRLSIVPVTLFLSVENVFDAGRIERIPTIPLRDQLVHQPLERFNSLYDYLMDPGRQPRPRLMKVGFSLNF